MKTKSKDKDENYDLKKKNSDEMFCYSCGSVVKINASVCPKCGVTLGYISLRKKTKKERETAIFLAMFTSFFAWLYLYDKSMLKFWIGFVISLLSIIIAKLAFDINLSYWYLSFIPLILIWIFVIIDVAIKNKYYFESFGGN